MLDNMTVEEASPAPPVVVAESPPDTRRNKYRTAATAAAACAVPLLYVLYVVRYSVDVPELDEWLRVHLVHHAIHGRLSWGDLWAPYNEGRILVGNLIYAVSGLVDHFDIRTLMFLNAALFIASFWLLLAIFRKYKGKRAGAISILVMSVIWFSVADAQNPLTGTQDPYLVVFFMVSMIFLLHVPRGHRNLFLALAALAAVGASLTAIQGFLLWPVGFVCVLWNDPRARRTWAECASWVAAAGLTLGLYSINFKLTSGCAGRLKGQCSLHFAVHHPVAAMRFLSVLVGNVVPTGYWGSVLAPPKHFLTQELVGVTILLSAVFVVVQTVRQHGMVRVPLPLLLIGFGLLYDLVIVEGRAATGLNGAVGNNRYVLPNLIMLLGVVIYALTHIPPRRRALGEAQWRFGLRWLVVGVLGVFLATQLVVSTRFGTRNGVLSKDISVTAARIMVNLDRVPASERGCELGRAMYSGLVGPAFALEHGSPILAYAKADHLTIFQPGSFRAYRAAGLPPISSACTSPKP